MDVGEWWVARASGFSVSGKAKLVVACMCKLEKWAGKVLKCLPPK
jgi:hypothetical protein